MWPSGSVEQNNLSYFGRETHRHHACEVLLKMTQWYRRSFQLKIVFDAAQNIDCEYSLEPPRRGGSNEYPQSIFLSRIMKIFDFFV